MTVGPLRIALATDDEHPRGDADDQPVIGALAARGAHAEAVVWSDPVRWDAWDGVVIRSCWNYDRRESEFRTWLDRLTARGIPVLNRPALIQATIHKGYLLDLAATGVAVAETRVVRRGDSFDLAGWQGSAGWPDIVVKPAVSLDGRDTFLVRGAATPDQQQQLDHLADARDVLVQRFLPEVTSVGELSCVFFAGRFSHAVRKRPAPDEFRSQERYGGRAEVADADPETVRTARRALEALGAGDATYARVDGVPVDTSFVVMEVELIDPTLFLMLVPGAAERFAESTLAGWRAAPPA